MRCYCCGDESKYLQAEFNRRNIGLGGGGGTRFFCRGCLEVTPDKKKRILREIETRDKGFRLIASCSKKARKDEDIIIETNWSYRQGGNDWLYV